jgi:hypothetical protein
VHFPFDILIRECFFCLFGNCKFYIRMTVHLM